MCCVGLITCYLSTLLYHPLSRKLLLSTLAFFNKTRTPTLNATPKSIPFLCKNQTSTIHNSKTCSSIVSIHKVHYFIYYFSFLWIKYVVSQQSWTSALLGIRSYWSLSVEFHLSFWILNLNPKGNSNIAAHYYIAVQSVLYVYKRKEVLIQVRKGEYTVI